MERVAAPGFDAEVRARSYHGSSVALIHRGYSDHAETHLQHSLLTTGALLLALATPVSAQQQTPARPVTGGDEQTMLVGVGLTFMDVSDSTGIGAAANVLFNALRTNETGRLGIVGDFGINDFDGGTIVTAMGGPRFTFNTQGRVLPYAQFLVGLSRCCGDTDFVPAIGGGIDVAFRPNLNFRGEIQFIFDDANATRFFLGVSLPINKR